MESRREQLTDEEIGAFLSYFEDEPSHGSETIWEPEETDFYHPNIRFPMTQKT